MTRRGEGAAVLVPVAEWRRLQRSARTTLKELLLAETPRGEIALPVRGRLRRRVPEAVGCAVYLLDTNVVSELRRPKPHGGVVAWLRGVADAELHLAAVTLGEIQAGVEITREQDRPRSKPGWSWWRELGTCWRRTRGSSGPGRG